MHHDEHPRPRAHAVEPLLTVRDVCTALNVGRTTVYEFVRDGELVPTYCGGSRPRFEPAALRDFIRRRRRAALPAHEQAFVSELIETFDGVKVDEGAA